MAAQTEILFMIALLHITDPSVFSEAYAYIEVLNPHTCAVCFITGISLSSRILFRLVPLVKEASFLNATQKYKFKGRMPCYRSRFHAPWVSILFMNVAEVK